MEVILWKLHTGVTWRDIPQKFCSWKTAYIAIFQITTTIDKTDFKAMYDHIFARPTPARHGCLS